MIYGGRLGEALGDIWGKPRGRLRGALGDIRVKAWGNLG